MASGGQTLVIGDLHLGNINSDLPSFLQLLDNVANIKSQIREVILLGDVIDGIDKYRTQNYKQYPETLETQKNLFNWLISMLLKYFKNARLVVVLGNHDADFRGNILINMLDSALQERVLITPIFINRNGCLFVHLLSPRSRYGSLSGWTPSMVSKAQALLTSFSRHEDRFVNCLVTAHVHKSLDILHIGGNILILLPAFLCPRQPSADAVLYQPSIITISHNVVYDGLKIFSKPCSSEDDIRLYNDVVRIISREDPQRGHSPREVIKIVEEIRGSYEPTQ